MLHRTRTSEGIEEIHLSGTLPPGREGPPLHIHALEDEIGRVIAGTLPANLDGKALTVGKYRGTEWPGCPARCAGAPSDQVA